MLSLQFVFVRLAASRPPTPSRRTGTRRPPNTTDPGALPCQFPCRCASLAVISAVIISPITARPTVVHIANSRLGHFVAIDQTDSSYVLLHRWWSPSVSVDLAVARHLPRRQVSGGGTATSLQQDRGQPRVRLPPVDRPDASTSGPRSGTPSPGRTTYPR